MHDIILILKSEMVHYIFENLNFFGDTLTKPCDGADGGTSILLNTVNVKENKYRDFLYGRR